MATDKKISDLTSNPTITGLEEIPLEKSDQNYKNTFDDLKAYVLADVPASGVQSVTGSKVDNTDPENPIIEATTKTDVGLGNADNTSDADKPVSTANQTALALKADKATLTQSGGNVTGLIDTDANTFSLTASDGGLTESDLYGTLPTYDITDISIDKNYILDDYSLISDRVIGFNLVTAKIARCIYLKIEVDGLSKINFSSDSVTSITGMLNGEILTQGKYTIIGIYNGGTVDVSVALIDENLTPISIPTDGLEVFFDFINQSTLTLDSGLITTANSIAEPSYFANQSTTGAKPTFDAVRGALMDGTDDFLSSNVPVSLMNITGVYTMFLVFQRDTPDGFNDLMALYENSESASNYNACFVRSGTFRQGIYEVGGVGFNSESIAVSENERHISYFTNQNKVVDMELDNIPSTGTDTIYTGIGVANSLQLGVLGGTRDYYFKGSIEKVIIYNRILTSGEKTQVLNYLA